MLYAAKVRIFRETTAYLSATLRIIKKLLLGIVTEGIEFAL